MSGVIMVLGERGQVAGQLAKVAARQSRKIVLAGRRTCDLLSELEPTRLLDRIAPIAVINAAAYSAVDAAETDQAAAFRLNGEIPGIFAHACAERGVPFIHFSTDYVFDGEKGQPYTEEDARNPLNAYGKSKSLGEDTVAQAGDLYTILRTSWLFSETRENFVKTMLRLAETRDEISVVSDQEGTPTYAEDCALAAFKCVDLLAAGDRSATGLFHLAGEGHATWAELAEAAFAGARARGLPWARVKPIATADYGSDTHRPSDTRLDTTKIREVLCWRDRPWQDGLNAALDHIRQMHAA